MDVIVSGITVRRTGRQTGPRRGLACLAGVAFAQAAVGIGWLVEHWRAAEPGRYQATAGSLFLILAFVQLLRVTRAWRKATPFDSQRLLRYAPFWGFHLLGVVGACSLALTVGPADDVAYLFALVLAIQYTVAGFWVLVSPVAASRLVPWLGDRRLRASSATVAAAVAGVLTLELALWAREQFGDGLVVSGAAQEVRLARRRDPAPRLERAAPAGPAETRLAKHVAPAARLRSANPHIALVTTTAGTQPTDCAPLVEEQLPGATLRVIPSGDGSVEQIAAACFADKPWREPNLVLVFVSVSHRLSSRAAPASWFDWRAWRVATMFVDAEAPSEPETNIATVAAIAPQQGQNSAQRAQQQTEQRQEQHLRDGVRTLRLCRTETDEAVDRAWQDLWTRLAGLHRHCTRRGAELALVVVPAEFQVRPELCSVLRRRGGFAPDELDVELPQRRLAAFAHEQSIAVIDLLPHLRAAGAPVFERHAERLNAAGNRVTADTLARWLAVHYGEPETPVAQAGAR